jgi:Holliday junction resolvasome RuvABC endonuclease subunit
VILTLDTSSRKNGYCAGDGTTIPVASAFILDQHEEDIGAMLEQFDANVSLLFQRFQPTVCVFESPILPSGGGKGDKGPVMGSTLTRRKLFNVAGHFEWMCHTRGIPCGEEEARTIKKELAGSRKADKEDMVAAALKCGIVLPPTQAAGMEDAADAFGLWLIGLRKTNRELSARWDRLLYSSRGALL